MNGNLKALVEGFSALNKRLAFDSKLPKIRTWAHAKHWWAQAKHYTGNDFHASTLASWTVLDSRHSYHALFQSDSETGNWVRFPSPAPGLTTIQLIFHG
jgi:hypothetical protein